jgi:hypothetical protein
MALNGIVPPRYTQCRLDFPIGWVKKAPCDAAASLARGEALRQAMIALMDGQDDERSKRRSTPRRGLVLERRLKSQLSIASRCSLYPVMLQSYSGGGGLEEDSMHTQIVMDHTGDTRHHFDANDRAEIAKAEKRFMQLTGAGYIAAKRTGVSTSELIHKFDPAAEETLFIPRLIGG